LSTQTVHRVREFGTVDVPIQELLDDAGELRLNPDVEGRDYFTIQLIGRKVCLQARGHVGLIPLNSRVSIDVEPRTPARNLARLLTVAQQAPQPLLSIRSYERDSIWTESLLEVYAHTLIVRLEEIGLKGLLREYEQGVEVTSFPRGRILTTETALHRSRRRGAGHQVVTSHYERSVDNAANRCLKYALWFLAMRLRSQQPLRGRRRQLLNRITPLYELFGETLLDHSLAFLRDPVVSGSRPLPSLRSYYRPAVALAAAIVEEHGAKLESREGPLELPSVVLNMSRLFENYLRNVLVAEAQRRDWYEHVLDGNGAGKTLLFDEEPSEKATPDIVVRDPETGSHPLLIEIKNIPVKGRNSDRSSIQQAATYGLSYRCNHVVIAHPRNQANSHCGLRTQGTLADLTLHQYVFDLAANSIVEEEQRFATAMEGLLQEAK
jgi:5-methylcytosine-specific restriction enzyme subunit McrC